MPYYKGIQIPSGEEFGKAWDQAMAERLAKLHFRIRPYASSPDRDPIDLHNCITNELIYRILLAPRAGRPISFGEAVNLKELECYNEKGELVTLAPCSQDTLVWAQKNGYYIQFAEGELEFVGAEMEMAS